MEAKKNPKADLSKSSLLFFQIGLIFMLSVTYFGLEWKTYDKNFVDDYQMEVPDEVLEDIPITQLNTPPPPPPPPPPATPELVEIVEDEIEVEEDVIESTESSQDQIVEIVQVKDIVYEEEEEVIEEVPFVTVENVPIFPGCEKLKGNDAQKKCMSEKIDALVKREFNSTIGAELGLNGIHRIIIMFRIDEKGDIVDIQSRAPHKRLKEEAERVIKLLPKMTPGQQRNRPVRVSYSLPIVFEVRQRV